MPIAVMVALAAVLLGATGPASGAADKKTVSASISPAGAWSRGATIGPASITIANGSGSQQLGSADLCIPNSLSISGSIPKPASSPCTTTRILPFRNLAIPAGGTGTRSLGSFAVPCDAPSTLVWKLHAKQSNDFSGLPGNNFSPYPFTLNVSVTGACTLEFVTQPADAEFDAATGTSNALVAKSNGSAIQVRATSGGLPVANAMVTITSGAPGDLTGGAATATAPVTGIASFSNLKRKPAGGPYTLTASSPGFTSDMSDEFFVVDLICETSPCTVTKQIGETSITVTQSGFDDPIGILLDGEGSGPGQCTGGTPAGDDFRIEIRPFTVGITEITWRLTKDKRLKNPNNGQTYELCVGTKLASGYSGPILPAFPVQVAYDSDGDGLANADSTGRHWGVLTDAPSSTKCDASYSIPYPTKISENSSGADAIQVACFPYPFDPQGLGFQ